MSGNTGRFPEKYRLSRPSDFKAVFKSARRYADKCFIVFVSTNSRELARLGLSVSAKRIPAAVRRNRVKRLIRESFRFNKARLKGRDIIVVAQSRAEQENNERITRSLSDLWDRITK